MSENDELNDSVDDTSLIQYINQSTEGYGFPEPGITVTTGSINIHMEPMTDEQKAHWDRFKEDGYVANSDDGPLLAWGLTLTTFAAGIGISLPQFWDQEILALGYLVAACIVGALGLFCLARWAAGHIKGWWKRR